MQFKNFEAISKNKKESAFIMRKQTKIVAVASAAAILAIGASMTSFAATGWVEESGEWYYYDKDGVRVEDEWKKSGDSWYWLDSEENGAMAMDKLIEDGDNYYYVDSTGKMASNTWVKVVNEDQDDDDDPAEYNYYYMQSNGKAFKAGDAGNTKFRTVDGKKYAFDGDGKMLYGWCDENGNRLSGDSEWEDATYYLGNWDDGAMKTGWQKVYVFDEDEDEDMDHWFNFKSNGKKREWTTSDTGIIKEVKINGKRYGFDSRGVMTYEWTLATDTSLASTSSWKYFNSPEDGARATKGWFKVVAPTEDNSFGNKITGAPTKENTFAKGKAEDESEKWYYADGDGNLVAGEIKKIKGKYYAFHKEAWMLNGLVLMSVGDDGTEIEVMDDGVDSDELDDLMDNKYKKDGVLQDTDGYSLYYFGSDEDNDGAMKTGSTTVTLDGSSYNFSFNKSGGVESKGKGITGIDDGKYIYKMGVRLKADSDDKYKIVYAVGDTSAVDAKVTKIDSKLARAKATPVGQNKDGDSVRFAGDVGETWSTDYYLVNTSGNIQKSKTAAKDGDDWYFYVDDKNIVMYTNNKTLTDNASKGYVMSENLTGWKNWTQGAWTVD